MASQILRLPDLELKTGLRRSTIFRLESRGEFPARVQLSQRTVGWIESEVDDWLSTKIEQRRNVISPALPATD